jgi:hypothetical protein
MTLKTVSLLVPNAILFIMGADTNDIPEIERGASVWSTPTCIAVGCQPDVDGETSVTLASVDQINMADEPVFDGELATPTRLIAVDVVPGKKILQENVSAARIRLRIWTNHPTAPDRVTIVFG